MLGVVDKLKARAAAAGGLRPAMEPILIFAATGQGTASSHQAQFLKAVTGAYEPGSFYVRNRSGETLPISCIYWRGKCSRR